MYPLEDLGSNPAADDSEVSDQNKIQEILFWMWLKKALVEKRRNYIIPTKICYLSCGCTRDRYDRGVHPKSFSRTK